MTLHPAFNGRNQYFHAGRARKHNEIYDFGLATQKVWHMGWMYITYVTVCIGGRTCQLRLTASQSENMRDIFKLEHQCVLSPPRFLIKIFLLRGCQADSKIYMDHHPTDKFCAFQLSSWNF